MSLSEKTKPSWTGLCGTPLSWMHLQNPGGLRQERIFLVAALVLHLAELLEGLVEADGEAMFVEADVCEGLVLFAKRFRHGESSVNLVVVRVDTVRLFCDA